MAASPNPVTRYLWHIDAEGWPLKRIDTLTGEHVPIFIGGPEKSLHRKDGGRPLACSIPKVSGVERSSVVTATLQKTESVEGSATLPGSLVTSSQAPSGFHADCATGKG